MTLLHVAHRAGNTPDLLTAALADGADLVEADVHLYRGRLEIRHTKTMGLGDNQHPEEIDQDRMRFHFFLCWASCSDAGQSEMTVVLFHCRTSPSLDVRQSNG